ncbi:hypothetical protein SAMN06297144_2365 [Sphingomonas guangdongensis]|uniref:DUF4349 domain-containing protein n=1 Tax=Sphingomonas guangdongensis TaxID=1141890 RepID=A0A285R0E9_9SPHN|nr:hypothetical protein [Sphingomonas guangdongensis]SOB87238.1 hypothetical protein SAMN06297144_2365 [Sphingomonas guangdongensis]
MLRHAGLLIALALAGCGAATDEQSSSAREGGPGVEVTAAPGVAFSYHYAFRLPAARIAAAQEAHAQACERLGVTRCRITGMRYSVVNEERIDASLAFKLAPALARSFGRAGIAAIERADGMLAAAEITGTDVGSGIARDEAGQRAAAGERARIERDLARPGLTGAERAELLRQRAALDDQVRGTAAAVAEGRDSLASTPMLFDYATGEAIRGVGPRSTIARAVATFMESAEWTFATLLWLLATLGPPLLLLAVLALLWRRFAQPLRRWWGRDRTPAA